MTSTPHTLARASAQLPLLSIAPRFNITKNAQARNAYGTVAAEIVCATLKLDAIPINGNYSVCFDAERNGHFYEIKSVKRGGKVVIYDWRMEKERAAKVPLSYAILCHNVRKSNGVNLAAEMLCSGLELLVLPAHVVHEAAARQPLRKLLRLALDPRNGYTRAGYRDGYRNVPVKKLKALCPTLEWKRWCNLYDLRFDIVIYAPPLP